MVNDNINKKLPIVNTFWKKAQKHLIMHPLSIYDWKKLINEHIRPGEYITRELMTEFIDDLIAIQKEILNPVKFDVVFEQLTDKYKGKRKSPIAHTKNMPCKRKSNRGNALLES